MRLIRWVFVNKVLKALSDPTRRQILKLLSKGELSAGRLAEESDLTAATMTHHFNVLRDAELIRSRKEGTTVIYTLNASVLQEVMLLALELMGTQKQLEEETDKQK